MIDALRDLLAVVERNQLRVGLTMLGVFWGMFMLLALLGLGDGLETAVHRTLRGTAPNAVSMWGGRTYRPYAGMQPGRWVRFNLDDVAALADVRGIEVLAPRRQLGRYRDTAMVRRGDRSGGFTTYGDVPAFAQIQPMVWLAGRWINQRDLDEQRKVAVIGKQVADELFPDGEDPIGQAIEVGGVYLTVVGMFNSARADESGDREASAIHAPLTTVQAAFNLGDEIGWISFLVADEEDATEVEERARGVLMERASVHPEDRESVRAWNTAEEFQKLRGLFWGIRLFVWFAGAATLLAGVVGVSNILMITVRERTREIGVRRAIGATRRQVIAMILREAAAMTVVAGAAGIVAGVALIEAIAWYVGPNDPSLGQPKLDLATAMAAATLLLGASLIAGLLPASRAAAIRPVEALRSE